MIKYEYIKALHFLFQKRFFKKNNEVDLVRVIFYLKTQKRGYPSRFPGRNLLLGNTTSGSSVFHPRKSKFHPIFRLFKITHERNKFKICEISGSIFIFSTVTKIHALNLYAKSYDRMPGKFIYSFLVKRWIYWKITVIRK